MKSIYSLVTRVVIHRSHFLKRNDSLIIVFNANPSSFFLVAPVTSVMIVSAALGELILPLVVGQVSG